MGSTCGLAAEPRALEALVAALRTNMHLRTLDLRDQPLTDALLGPLQEALGRSGVERVHLMLVPPGQMHHRHVHLMPLPTGQMHERHLLLMLLPPRQMQHRDVHPRPPVGGQPES